MPAPRDDRQTPHDDPLRVTLFVNDDEEAAPPFGLLEVVGYDADTQAFRVTRPTRTGANDLLVNGPVAINPGEEGQAFIGTWLPMQWADDGGQDVQAADAETAPDYGDTLGSIAGEWYASRRAAGYLVTAKYGGEGDKVVVVRPQNYNLVEYVQITACIDDSVDTAPATYSHAKIVYFDPAEDVWVEPPEDILVWYRDQSGIALSASDPTAGGPCRVRAMNAGTGHGRMVYVGDAAHRCDPCENTTTTTTTTQPPTSTTPGPCTGECFWDWDNATRTYTFVSASCSTGCDCLPPSFIPSTNSVCSGVRVRTECGRTGGTSAAPPNCSTTTAGPTTTTTTTTGPGCTGCKWGWMFPGWVRVETETYTCDSCYGCAYPSVDPVVSGDECNPVFTPCNPPPPPPPPPYCSGDCRWVAGYDDVWRLKNYNCASYNVPNCTCDAPAHVPECGDFAITPCYPHNDTGTTTAGPPPASNLCSTTLPPFGSCNGGCIYQWWEPPQVAVAQWVKTFHGCPGCSCSPPEDDGTYGCEARQVACETQTTTTTTTTQPPTTTTAEPGECGCCWEESWYYVGPYDLDPSLNNWQFVGGTYLGGDCVGPEVGEDPAPGECSYAWCSASKWAAVGGGGGGYLGGGMPPAGWITGTGADSCGEWSGPGALAPGQVWTRTCCMQCEGETEECCGGLTSATSRAPTTTTTSTTTTVEDGDITVYVSKNGAAEPGRAITVTGANPGSGVTNFSGYFYVDPANVVGSVTVTCALGGGETCEYQVNGTGWNPGNSVTYTHLGPAAHSAVHFRITSATTTGVPATSTSLAPEL